MGDREHATLLLRLARRDLNALIGMGKSDLFADEIFGFHAQQTVEKALKAWLSARGAVYPLTHELSRLLALLENTGVDVEPFWPLCRFTPFAVQARYEEGPASLEDGLNRAAIVAELDSFLNRVDAIVEASGE
jgi:HEPN domain-containing protein